MNQVKRNAVHVLVTVEHATNAIAKEVEHLFVDHEEILTSHRAYDYGALAYAKALSENLSCPLIQAPVSRLVIDCNRSMTHPKLFSEFTKQLTQECREGLIESYWRPFRHQAFCAMQWQRVVHLSCHTFTPILGNKVRSCDIGLLYDPASIEERAFVRQLASILSKEISLKVRMNYPYRGTSDGHVTSVRGVRPHGTYVGLEIEINQALVDTPSWNEVGMPALCRAIRQCVQTYERCS